jgi:MoxR-like ATPase
MFAAKNSIVNSSSFVKREMRDLQKFVLQIGRAVLESGAWARSKVWKEYRIFAERVIENVSRVVVGQRESLELMLTALLCEGHILIEDVPGVGKTMLARALAASLGLSFRRLQCTPDLLPNDVTGVSVFNQQSSRFEFIPGPVFSNIVLADEINRATPRTQSALLEAMGERQVTVDGVTRALSRPFVVFATQNPVEYEGTFPLPEAQLDRFFVKLQLGYLPPEAEGQMLVNLQRRHPIEAVEAVVDDNQLLELAPLVWEVHVDETVRDYIVRLANGTRGHPDLLLGASPRGSLALYKASQAWAALHGRDFVLPDDIKRLAPSTLAHRCLVHPESSLRGRTANAIIGEVLQKTPLDLGK